MLHVSRPVRWDSDHVVIFDDALIRIMRSLVRDDLLGRTNIGLDFFDATINRVSAWVVGARASQKAILQAMLAPIDDLKKAEEQGDYTKRLAVTEELKSIHLVLFGMNSVLEIMYQLEKIGWIILKIMKITFSSNANQRGL